MVIILTDNLKDYFINCILQGIHGFITNSDILNFINLYKLNISNSDKYNRFKIVEILLKNNLLENFYKLLYIFLIFQLYLKIQYFICNIT